MYKIYASSFITYPLEEITFSGIVLKASLAVRYPSPRLSMILSRMEICGYVWGQNNNLMEISVLISDIEYMKYKLKGDSYIDFFGAEKIEHV